MHPPTDTRVTPTPKRPSTKAPAFTKGTTLIRGSDVLLIGTLSVCCVAAIGFGLLFVFLSLHYLGLYDSIDTAFDGDWVEYVFMIGLYGSMLIAVHGMIVMRRSIDWRGLGLRAFNFRQIRHILILVGLYWIVMIGSSLTGVVSPLEQLIVPTQLNAITVITMLIVFGPLTAVAEEVFFRGLIHRWMRQRLAVGHGSLASAAVFSLAHFYFIDPGGSSGINATIFAALFGLLAAHLYERTSSLWPGIAVHGCHNMIFVTISIFKSLG